jgi:carbon storage regulator CsrA
MALVLSCKHGQSITLDGPAKITVIQRGGKVQLAIEAPTSTSIMRDDAKDSNRKEPDDARR